MKQLVLDFLEDSKKSFIFLEKEFIKLDLLAPWKNWKRIDTYVHQLGCKGFYIKGWEFFKFLKFYKKENERDEIFKEYFKYDTTYIKTSCETEDNKTMYGLMKKLSY